MQLIYLLILILITSVRDLIAENYVNLRTMRYEDSDKVKIWEGLVLYQTDLNTKSQLSVQYGIDSVTSASTSTSTHSNSSASGLLNIQESKIYDGNMVTSARTRPERESENDETESSSGEVTKIRHSGSLAYTHLFENGLKQTSSFQFSTKSDYDSVTLGQNFLAPIGQLTTLSFGAYYTANNNDPEIATTNTYLLPPDKNLDSSQITGIVTVERILSPISKVKLICDYFDQTGYLSTGYQVVPIDSGTTSGKALEVLPERRFGGGIAAIYSRFIGDDKAIHLKTRFFKDSFSISSWSEQVKFRKYMSDDLIWESKIRYYSQSEASFWGYSFSTLPDGYFTNHYALSTIQSTSIGTGFWYDTTDFGTINAQIEYYSSEHLNYLTVSTGIEFRF